MIFVMHMDEEVATVVVDGRLLTIPPDFAFEVPEIRGNDMNNNGHYEYIIPDHQVAAKVREHGWYHGIVDVPVIRTGNAITVDTDAARVAAKTALMAAQDAMLTLYITEQQERIKGGKAALPPDGRVATVIERRGIDLRRDFSIDPPGYTLGKIVNREAEIDDLKKEVAEQRRLRETENVGLKKQLADLFALLEKK